MFPASFGEMPVRVLTSSTDPAHDGVATPSRLMSVIDSIALACIGALALGAIAYCLGARPAQAVPSYARQTGQPCAACHTAFPELTPFGRRFKLGGYTLGGGDSNLPPLSMMVVPSFTHTQKAQDTPPADGFRTNNNFALQTVSLFFGGAIYGNLGAFVQTTYDGASKRFSWDNTDIRYANTAKLLGQDLVWGVTLHNNPTVQDVWNTTPAWGFPQVASTLAPAFSPPKTILEGGFANQVGGAGVYTFWNDMLYAEVSGYRTLSSRALTTLGVDPTGSNSIRNIAPYWRLALEPTWGNHSLMVGTFGMIADVNPGRIASFGADRYSDFGFDTQYQYIDDIHAFTGKLTYILEKQHLTSTFAQMGSDHLNNTLRSFKATAGYVYDRKYSFTGSFFDVSGSSDFSLYGGNSLRGSPNGRGLIFDVAYLPFSRGGPAAWPWLNTRIGISYTQYLKLYGGATNFDGAGHNASDNNTLFAFAWLIL